MIPIPLGPEDSDAVVTSRQSLASAIETADTTTLITVSPPPLPSTTTIPPGPTRSCEHTDYAESVAVRDREADAGASHRCGRVMIMHAT